jgi:hypothetical protein
MDAGDYTWALTVAPFAGEAWGLAPVRQKLLEDARAKDEPRMLATHFALLASLDTEFHDEAAILAEIDRDVPYAARPGRYLPMPFTAPEMAGVVDGDPAHDVRPQAFSVGPWVWTVAGLGLRRLPFGLAVRANSALDAIERYEYGKALLDVAFEGTGPVEGVTLDGRPLLHTLQLPEKSLAVGPHRVRVLMARGRGAALPLLVSSTVRLEDVARSGEGARYDVQAFGENVLVFRGEPAVAVHDASGRTVPVSARTIGGHRYVRFEGRGRFAALASLRPSP